MYIRRSDCSSPLYKICHQDTRHMSAAKKAIWCTNVFFAGTANSPFSTPRFSVTTGLICYKVTYFMLSIYATLHTKFERNWLSSSRNVFMEISPVSSLFSSSSFSLHHFTKVILSQPKTPFS